MKKTTKLLYTDIPDIKRPYDEDAKRLVRRVGLVIVFLFFMGLCLIAISL